MTITPPTPHLWTAGEEVDAELINGATAILHWMLDPPEIEVKQTTLQTITTATWTPITFHSVVKDNYADFEGGAAHWLVGAPTNLVVQAAGWYEAELTTAWAASTVTRRIMHALRINTSASADFRGRTDRKAHSSGTGVIKTIKSVYDIWLNPADIVNLMVWQQTGSNLNTSVAVPESRLALRWTQLSGT